MESIRSKAIERPVLVANRHGTRLPYSKGLMAASIMATGVPPEDAYRLAGVVAGELAISPHGRITGDTLAHVAAAVLERERGRSVAERYLAWRRAKRSSRPIVVLIGGATGVGKSVVATKLAARLDMPHVIPTDAVREVMRSFLPRHEHGEIHRSSFGGGRRGDRRAAVAGFMEQAHSVGRGVGGLVERLVVEQRDGIVEGVHVVPGILDGARMPALQRQAVIVQVLLVLDDPQAHRAHFHHRSEENAHGRSQHDYLDRLDDIRSIQDHLREAAVAHSVPTIAAGDLDAAIQTVLEHVVDEAVDRRAVAKAI